MPQQIVLIGCKKYYQHPVFTNYAASKEGEVINVKTGRKMKMCKNHAGYYRFDFRHKKRYRKTATSKKDGQKYSFEYLK